MPAGIPRRSAKGLVANGAALRPLSAVPLDPCEKRAARVSSALVRYRTNDFSVPTAYGFQAVVVKGFEPGDPRTDCEQTINDLMSILDRSDLVEATDRLEAQLGLRIPY